jgi:CMP-N-acetylneuraminic acid synthetase
MKILCTICVRGGSKGLRNKNIKNINGKPLVSYTINQAIKSKIFDNIAISSDSYKILNIAKKFGITDLIKRPKNLAIDSAPKIPVIKHCLAEMEMRYKKKYDLIVDLDATAPLRKIIDIKKAVHKMIKSKASNLFSVCESRSNPYFNAVEIVNNKVQQLKKLKKNITSRQSAPKVFDINASIYIWRRDFLNKYESLISKKTIIYIMPESRSLDIDTNFHFKLARFLINKK